MKLFANRNTPPMSERPEPSPADASLVVYTCSCCGKQHSGLPALTYKAPDHYLSIPEEERTDRCTIDTDFCSVDEEHFFVRCVMTLPIIGTGDTLEWGVWGSLSETNFNYYREIFDEDPPAGLDSFFSWFSSELGGYEPTLALKCSLDLQNNGQRPLIRLHECDHQLYRDQTHGISIERALELAEPFLKRIQH
jgi:hypothetical protein